MITEVNEVASSYHVQQLLASQIPCIHITNAVSRENCSKLVAGFLASPGRRPRSDGVPGDVLGFYHYGKTYSQYQAEARINNQYVEHFLQQGGDPVEQIIDLFRESISEKDPDATIRPASWNNQQSAKARALSWTHRVTSSSYLTKT